MKIQVTSAQDLRVGCLVKCLFEGGCSGNYMGANFLGSFLSGLWFLGYMRGSATCRVAAAIALLERWPHGHRRSRLHLPHGRCDA